jgi:hypothetical protein
VCVREYLRKDVMGSLVCVKSAMVESSEFILNVEVLGV